MSDVVLWPVDPLEKVFEDAIPPEEMSDTIVIECARNEWASGQFVFMSPEINLMHTRHRASSLTPVSPENAGDEGNKLATAANPTPTQASRPVPKPPLLPPPELRFVGFVPVRNNTPNTPEDHLIRSAPARFPDPLLDDDMLHIRRGTSQPVWITIFVPIDTVPGQYRGTIEVLSRGEVIASLNVVLKVHQAFVPEDRRLNVTNWFSLSNICRSHGVEMFSQPFWDMLGRYAQIMAEHGQNTLLTPLFSLIRPMLSSPGDIDLDFTLFDRWVKLFDDHGMAEWIEGGHLGGRKGGWNEGFAIHTWQVIGNEIKTISADVGSKEAETFLSWFLPKLRDHLTQRGWLGRYMQHLADEPVDANADSYNTLMRTVRKYWPDVRLIDANMCQSVDALDVWVPILNVWHEAYDFYKKQQANGHEVWFYTCLGPTGTYANRLIDYASLKVRILHWLNAHYGATGYLHWGLNYWDGLSSPFADVEPAHNPDLVLPPGDCGIVYPGPKGPLSSIRFEAMRDGIADFALLNELARHDKAAASKFTGRIIRGFDDYHLDIDGFRKTRRELLDAVSQIQATNKTTADLAINDAT